MTRRLAFGAALVAILAGSLALRLPDRGGRPMHGDEAVHTIKFDELWRTGRYVYDPNEYHGPTLYYATLPVVWAEGRKDFGSTQEADYRLVTVLFGAGMVLLLALLADGLGRAGTLLAAGLLAASPAFCFYSRYYIQEPLLAFFTLAALAFAWRYHRRPGVGWAAALGVAAGLMMATKETAVLTFAAAACALAVMAAWRRIAGRTAPLASAPAPEPAVTAVAACSAAPTAAGLREAPAPADRPAADGSAGSRGRRGWHIALAAALAVLVAAFVLSGCFRNPSGAVDYLRAYTPWLQRAGGSELHRHPWSYYLWALLYSHGAGRPVWTEGLIVGLALVGAAFAFVRPRTVVGLGASPGFVRFVAVATLVLTVVYSATPYKTPWCVLSFLGGMALLGGVGAAALVRAARWVPLQMLVGVLVLAGVAHLAWLARLTCGFPLYTDEHNPYVYAQPSDDVIGLAEQVERVASAGPHGLGTVVKVVSTDTYYWPLPWYLRRMPNVGYYVGVPADVETPDESIVVASPDYADTLHGRIGRSHRSTDTYGLRPGAFMDVWVQKALWEAYLKTRRPGTE